jgi:pyruvate,water dikinase
VLSDTEDVFYLTLEECWDYVRGTAVTMGLRELAALRRTEFDRFRRGPVPPERFETAGLPYRRRIVAGPAAAERAEAGLLRGTGCSPGVVTAPVKVATPPMSDLALSGEILVAERMDPGWVPFYPAVAGLLVERGSILSHAGIVARELGIPAVIGIRGLLARVRTGQTVSMDGAAGTVWLYPVPRQTGMAGPP